MRIKELEIDKRSFLFRMLEFIQEEVHRYTVSKMSNAKAKTIKRSSLEKIKGIGSTKAKKLLAHFGGISAIKSASFDELVAVKGITKNDAQSIIDYYHNGV